MENLGFDGNFNQFDIKISSFYNPKYSMASFTREYLVSTTGYSIVGKDYPLEKLRGEFIKVSSEQLR